MKALKQRLADILAQAHGTRWDVVAGRVATGLGIIGGLSQYAGWIPGRTGSVIGVICVVCAGLSPRVTKAAGLLKTAQDQQVPLLKVLPQIISTLLAGPSIIAQAKAAEADEAKKQAQAADDERIAQKVKSELTKLGISRSALSGDVPADLQDALDKALPPAEQAVMTKPVSEGASSPGLTSTVTVEDKAP